MNDELKRDPEIAAALRRIEPDPPLESVDWDHLHSMIVRRAAGDVGGEAGQAAAAVHVVALRRRMNWLDYTARWARAAIPVSALITAILAFWLHQSISSQASLPQYSSDVSFEERDALSMAVSGEVTEHEVVDAITAPSTRDWPLYDVMENPDAPR